MRLLAERRAGRDDAAVEHRSPTWSRSRTDANMIPRACSGARVEATLGGVCDALRAEWGEVPGAGQVLTGEVAPSAACLGSEA